MTKNKALYAWFNQSVSGLRFYRNTAVPEDAELPYGTYEYVAGDFDSGPVPITVNLWFRTTSEALPDEKAQELWDRVGRGGAVIPCDGGYIWLKRSGANWQSLTDATDGNIKRRYANLSVEYLTMN